ncbi:ComEC/Rec2 family competence protein [Phaeacidiphilus oryzae]|uniref:ComEC/Rec2 family competence protein n=1 Tax=Phaeacidiphilus oryzae TaxID=348818 RepID=UPI000B109261|nr:ComEC/Rec2 family competence protein [Phaeacidiphilus oryzae]
MKTEGRSRTRGGPSSGAERTLDARLVGPALAAWGVAWALLADPPEPLPVCLICAVVAIGAGTLFAGGARWAACGLLLSAGAAALSAGLSLGELHRGPVPELARRQDYAELVLRVTTDPRRRGGPDGGGGPPRVVLDGRVEAVGRESVRTPVTVTVQGPASARWLGLLPSTRLRMTARVGPPLPGTPVAARLTTRAPPEVVAGPSTVQRIAGRLRAGLLRATERLPADPRALLPGLVVGDTSRFTEDLSEVFRAADLSHLTAVSGGNLSILLVILIGPPGRARTPERGGLAAGLGLPLRGTSAAGAALTVAFVVLCRPEPSVLRAAATGMVGLLALATGRRAHALPALAGATLVLLVTDPWLARSYGFGLSVLATTGLLTLGPRWAAALTARGWPERLAEPLAAAAAAQACCAPLLAVMASRVSLVAIPCNLLAEFAVAPATLLGLGALALEPVSLTAARVPAGLGALPASWITWVARRAAGLPGAEVAWPGGVAGALLLAGVVCAAVWALPVLRRHWLLPVALGLVLLAALLRPPPVVRLLTGWPPPGWDLVACAIGQGDAIVIRAGPDSDAALVVDTGPDPRAVDGCLRRLGVRRVPLLLLSHLHADHAEGVPGVLHGRSVGAIETTSLDEPAGEARRLRAWAGAAGVPVQRAVPGERRALGDLRWEVLWPPGEEELRGEQRTPNNASVALLLTVRGLRVALLGDLEPPAQGALPGGLGPVDVLKVAHHGSARQDPALLAALRPRVALISCGLGNPYGHPAPSTVFALHAGGATVLRTDTQGDVAVLGDARHLAVAARGPG